MMQYLQGILLANWSKTIWRPHVIFYVYNL